MTGSMRIGKRVLGAGHPAFLAAEVGINHNGDMNLARRMVEAAAAAGADGVKFQSYATADFLDEHRILTYSYRSQGQEVTEAQWDLFKRCELTREQLVELKLHCDKVGVAFFSTPTSAAGARLLRDIGAPVIKNGSDYLTHLELIQCMGSLGVPAVLSTGMATPEEIDDAVSAFRAAGGRDLVLLHCTSSYPTPAAEINLNRIPELARRYGCLAGFSDHSEGTIAAVGAASVGARFIEKHFTLDRDLPGPDHRFSSDPEEFRALTRAVREVETALGTSTLGPTPSEEKGRAEFRLSCQASSDLPAGTRLSREHILYRRPGTGLPPKFGPSLVGRALRHEVGKGHIFTWDDVDA